jgi:hypothetical protein
MQSMPPLRDVDNIVFQKHKCASDTWVSRQMNTQTEKQHKWTDTPGSNDYSSTVGRCLLPASPGPDDVGAVP